MSPDDFSPGSPGKLVPTVFREQQPSGDFRDVSGFGFVPDLLPPQLDETALLVQTHTAVLRAERALSHLDGVASQAENPALLIGPFQIREARLSSAIENTFASAEQMVLFGLDPTTVEEPKRDDVKEVNNYVSALHHAFKSDLPICLRLVKEIHERLLEGVARQSGRHGEFRTTQNAIGRAGSPFATARFVPPPPSYLDDLLRNWEMFVNDQSTSMSRLVRFAIAHYQFECIHPFDDGNGRIGRLLIAHQLCEQAQLSKPLVYVSNYFEQNRASYYDLLYEVSTKGNWMRWILFFLEAVESQASETSSRFIRLAELRDAYHDRVREKRASALLPAVVDDLFLSPALTVSQVRERTGVTTQAAGELVRKLVAKKILAEATGRQSHRVYVAPEILEIINS